MKSQFSSNIQLLVLTTIIKIYNTCKLQAFIKYNTNTLDCCHYKPVFNNSITTGGLYLRCEALFVLLGQESTRKSAVPAPENALYLIHYGKRR